MLKESFKGIRKIKKIIRISMIIFQIEMKLEFSEKLFIYSIFLLNLLTNSFKRDLFKKLDEIQDLSLIIF